MTETKMTEVYEETMSLDDGFAGRIVIRRHGDAEGWHSITSEVYRTMRMVDRPTMIVYSTHAWKRYEAAEEALPQARQWIRVTVSGLSMLVADATASVVEAVMV